jgi:2'-5' RNA ligase
MHSQRYGLVAYVRTSLGQFVESLRRDLHPTLPHSPAHLTVLPPRCLQGSESAALQTLEALCRESDAFEVQLDGVASFCPLTPTVFVRVTQGTEHLQALHRRLNQAELAACENWEYTPHLTVVKMATTEQALEALEVAQGCWSEYRGVRRLLIDELTFVRELDRDANSWTDVAPVRLGRKVAAF